MPQQSISIIESNSKHHIPARYIPKTLSKRDKQIQMRSLKRSRKAYKQGKYVSRPKIASFTGKKSRHVATARKLYNVANMQPTASLAKKTGCSVNGLQAILQKGKGAYFSSGSRPSQSTDSWAFARLASAITGGPASCVDYSILEKSCNNKTSKALRLAKKTCKL